MSWLLLLGGCRNNLSEAELRDMHQVQNGWIQILTNAEDKFGEYADKHNALVEAVEDTSNHWRQATLRQDSLLRQRITRLRDQFNGATRRHLATLKDLHTFIQDNESWLLRVETEGMPSRAARGSWEARTAQFSTMYQRVSRSQEDLASLMPELEKVRSMVPGEADSGGIEN